MSFFGLPQDAKNGAQRELDFEETFDDRLGDQLMEANDDLNDETFGSFSVGKDFDFAGQTAQVAGAIDEEQFTFARNQPVHLQQQHQQPSPAPSQVPSLQPIASLWDSQPASAPASAPRVMSLEEVERQMMTQRSKGVNQPVQRQQQQQQQQQPQSSQVQPQASTAHQPHQPVPQQQQQQPIQQHFAQPPPQAIPQNIPQQGGPFYPPMPGFGSFPPPPMGYPPPMIQDPAILNMQQPPPPPNFPPDAFQQQAQQQGSAAQNKPYNIKEGKSPVTSLGQVMNEENARSEAENERLLKKSQKIAQIVKYNGLMSRWDKNFIMRIQLQQMVTEDPYNEDFYYQVHSAIQSRNNPNQPLNAFAQTYLFQRGQRGGRFRRNENPLQRMQQQVQQAVASAREHPKKDQIVREGALGKISVGSGKRPRKALNVSKEPNRPASADALNRVDGTIPSEKGVSANLYNTKSLLRSIEDVFTVLLEVESGERGRPSEADQEATAEWQTKIQSQVDTLWDLLQVTAPVDANGTHPFILMLSHDKGKKLVPRVFRHVDQKQRLTILTRIIAHIDSLDVVKDGAYDNGEDLKARTRSSIELFSQTVLPPLVHLISESSYDVVIGLLEIMLNSNIVHVASTKSGLAFLTVLISRAELIKQDEPENDNDNWQSTFSNLFTKVQGHLLNIFPPRNVDDSYVWHFLASIALAAKLEHQRVLVDEVRDKIFGTMAEAKALPVELATQKIANLNLFLNVMGLNATTTEIGELDN